MTTRCSKLHLEVDVFHSIFKRWSYKLTFLSFWNFIWNAFGQNLIFLRFKMKIWLQFSCMYTRDILPKYHMRWSKIYPTIYHWLDMVGRDQIYIKKLCGFDHPVPRPYLIIASGSSYSYIYYTVGIYKYICVYIIYNTKCYYRQIHW